MFGARTRVYIKEANMYMCVLREREVMNDGPHGSRWGHAAGDDISRCKLGTKISLGQRGLGSNSNNLNVYMPLLLPFSSYILTISYELIGWNLSFTHGIHWHASFTALMALSPKSKNWFFSSEEGPALGIMYGDVFGNDKMTNLFSI